MIAPEHRPVARELFERVRSHLLRQGRRARPATGGGCQYRVELAAEGGRVLRCAVGCLIPEDAYDPAIEGTSLFFVSLTDGRWTGSTDGSARLAAVLEAAGVPTFPGADRLISRLQDVHDRIPPQHWASELEAVGAAELPEEGPP